MMRRRFSAWAAILAAASGSACSGAEVDGSPSSAGAAGQASGGAGGAGGGAQAGSGGTSGSGTGQAGGAGSAGQGQGSAGTAGGTGFTEVGVCGQRGLSTLTATAFDGYEEFYIIDEEGLGDDICVVRFEVTRVGEAPPGCVDTENVPCLWTHLVEFSNPSIEVDVDGVCENSELGLDADAIAAIDGTQAAYGFVSEYQGHNSVVMKHDPEADSWGPYGNATFDEETGTFRFDRRDGYCDFRASP